MRNLTFALSMILGTGWCSGAQAEIRGVARTEDVTVKLTRQVAALELRIKQLELGQAAINQKLNKTDVSDDGVGTVVKHEGKQRAFMGAADNGGGVVAVFGGDGAHPAAGMQLNQSGGGLVAVFKNDTAISFLTESTNHRGGGNVTTTDPAGKGVFSAGYDGDLGSACVGHKGSLHCLGIGLPLSGGN